MSADKNNLFLECDTVFTVDLRLFTCKFIIFKAFFVTFCAEINYFQVDTLGQEAILDKIFGANTIT